MGWRLQRQRATHQGGKNCIFWHVWYVFQLKFIEILSRHFLTITAGWSWKPQGQLFLRGIPSRRTLNILPSFTLVFDRVVNTAATPVVDNPRTVQVNDIYLHKVKGFPYWPVQVVRIDKKLISLVYYETGETNSVAMPGSDLVPFTDVTIANLRLEKIKNRKLQNAIAAARASVWVCLIGLNSYPRKTVYCQLPSSVVLTSYLLQPVVLA